MTKEEEERMLTTGIKVKLINRSLREGMAEMLLIESDTAHPLHHRVALHIQDQEAQVMIEEGDIEKSREIGEEKIKPGIKIGKRIRGEVEVKRRRKMIKPKNRLTRIVISIGWN